MPSVLDANFRRGLGLMLTGLWITLLGFVFPFFGVLGVVAEVIVIVVGGVVLARGFEILTRLPPASPPQAP